MRYVRELAPGQRSQVFVIDTVTGEQQLIHESEELLFEAPNWTRDGHLVLNGDGRLWRLRLEPGAEPELIPLEGVPDLNNDHVLSPVAEEVFVSANDWHIYAAPLAGGTVRRVTPDDGLMHFLHGVSPDGSTLAFIGVRMGPGGTLSDMGPGVVCAMDAAGGEARMLTSDAWSSDGSEYSPDGEWLYLNTEAFSSTPGHAQIARMPAGGGPLEQLTFDERVNWFPHLAPDGRSIVYLSYPAGTVGHPPDLPVKLRIVRDDDWSETRELVDLFGGQGTVNVNSWSPDSRRLAFVAYPIRDI
ncbi:biopolymer transporter Tol [Herbiconiux sp. 11R-BC]|uniref:TolB family protein n=1 Tax=Herbiconiux sp. 11R-BC TaxID=3111637 RepID=UPI003C060D8D